MSSTILSINAGSSSLKCGLYIAGADKKLTSVAKAEVSAIGQKGSRLKYTRDGQKQDNNVNASDHREAFQHVLKTFVDDPDVNVKSGDDIDYACHRVVQGGDLFEHDELITKETFHKIESLSDLAPLHNASATILMKACHEELPKVTNVACFDSSFHTTMPEAVKTYAIDQKIAKEKGLRKYGFHGLSYSYILRQVSQYLQKPREETNLIVLHLGSGASACAIKAGKSIDTSMGLTPASGLPGGTRSGDVDPSLVFHYTSDAAKLSPSSTRDLHISKAEEILNKQSGWKALTGTTDFAEIARPDAPETHKLALDILVDRIVNFIGAYYVKLNGEVDALVFAGGIGEKSAYLRRLVTDRCACLGFSIDSDKNDNVSGDDIISEIGLSDKKNLLVVATDEDYEMALRTMLHPK